MNKLLGVGSNKIPLLAMCFLLVSSAIRAEQWAVNYGEIDLQNWQAKNSLELAGNWKAILGKLASPQDIILGKYRVEEKITPINLSFKNIKYEPLSEGQGEITFYLKMKNLDYKVSNLGLRFKIDTSARIYFFESHSPPKLVYEVGHVDEDKEKHIPHLAYPLANLPIVKSGDYYLVIQVQNYYYGDGGIWKIPTISKYESESYIRNLELMGEIFSLGIIFIITIYTVLLFLQRVEDSSLLWLGSFCCLIFFRLLGTSGFIMSTLFPQAEYWIYYLQRHLEFSFVPLICSCAFGIVIHNFSYTKYIKLLNLTLVVSILYLLTTFLQPTKNLLSTLPIMIAIIVTSGLLVAYVIMKAFFEKKSGSTTFLISGMILFVSVSNDVALGTGIIKESIFISHYGTTILIFSFGLNVAQKFNHTFKLSEKLSHELEQEVQIKTRDITSIFASIPLGIISILANGKADANYSNQMNKIIDMDEFEKATFYENLQKFSLLTTEQISMIKSVVVISIGEPEFNFYMNHDHLPSEFSFVYNNHKSILEATWSPVSNQDQIVEKILLILKDVTEIRLMEKKSKNQREKYDFILEIINAPVEQFELFIQSTLELLEDNRSLIQKIQSVDDCFADTLLMNLHTIKGGSRTLGLKHLASKTHEAEDFYLELLKLNDLSKATYQLENINTDIFRIVKKYITIANDKLHRKQVSENQISSNFIEEQREILQDLDISRLDKKNSQIIAQILGNVSRATSLNFSRLIDEFTENARNIAKDLNKKNPRIHVISNKEYLISKKIYGILSQVFFHIIRNSLDHGIEDSLLREKENKDAFGNITINLKEDSFSNLEIKYEDDGRGIEIDKVRRKAVSLGIIDSGIQISVDEIVDLLFLSKLSTKKQVSDISGRGVGMGAVKHYLEKNKCSINLSLNQETFNNNFIQFSIIIKIPKNEFHIIASDDFKRSS